MLSSSYANINLTSEGACAIAYIRVSTAKQLRGWGPDAQRAAIEAYAKAASLKILDVVEEDHSATDATPLHDRPGFKLALDLAKRHSCPILVSRMHRLSRNVRSYDEFVRSFNVMIIPVCEVDTDVLPGQRARIAEAQTTAEIKAARQAAAFDRKRAAGEPIGNPNPSATTHKASVEARKRYSRQRVETIVAVMDEVGHGLSRPALAAVLNERGIRTSRGEDWNRVNIRRYHVEALRLLEERSAAAEAAKADAEENEMMKRVPGFGIF